jgi:hypothetical protein
MAIQGVNPDGSIRNRLDQLPRQAILAGWPTPNCPSKHDSEVSVGSPLLNRNQKGPEHLSGLPLSGIRALTESLVGFHLNPSFSRWLMGYPAAWDLSAAMATQLCRKSRRPSSPRSSRPKKSSIGKDE